MFSAENIDTISQNPIIREQMSTRTIMDIIKRICEETKDGLADRGKIIEESEALGIQYNDIIKVMEKVQENDTDDITELILGYEEKINKSKSIINEVEQYLGKNISDVEELIYDVIGNHDVILSEIYEKVSDEKNSKIKNFLNSTVNIDSEIIENVEEIIISENLTIKDKINKFYESFIES